MNTPRRLSQVPGRVLTGLLFTVVAGCSGDNPSGPDPASLVPAIVDITPGADTLHWVGASRSFSAIALNATGGLMHGESFSWSVDNAQVVTVSPSGLVTAVGPGSTTVRATAGSATGTAIVTVRQRPTAIVRVHGDGQVAPAGSVLPDSLVLELQDQGGTPVPSHHLEWRVSAGSGRVVLAQGQTNSGGRAFARWELGPQAGTQIMEVVAVDGLVQAFTATATQSSSGDGGLSISAVTPNPLVEGAEAVIEGSGLQGVEIRVDGQRAQVITSQSDRIRIRVPEYPCLPSREVVVQVGTGSAAVSQNVSLVPLGLMEPAGVGATWITRGASSVRGHCFQLPASQEDQVYLVGFQSMAEAVSTITPTRVRGQVGSSGWTASPALTPSAPTLESFAPDGLRPISGVNGMTVGSPVLGGDGPQRSPLGSAGAWMPSLHDHGTDAKYRIMESGLREARKFMADPAARITPPSAVSGTLAAPAVGSEVPIRVRTSGSCDEFTTIRGLVRHVGAHAIWVEDADNPSGGFTASDFTSFSMQFDQVTYPTLRQMLGEMTDLDGNGRAVIVVTKEVNRDSGLNGMFWLADLFPRSWCAASNQGEYFYAFAPDPTGVFGQARSLSEARSTYPRLLAHELAHIIHFGRQVFVAGVDPENLPTTWEAEGLATLVEELVGHRVLGLGSGRNLGWSAVVDGSPWYDYLVNDLGMYWGFRSTSSRVVGAPEQCSWLNRPDPISNGPCMGSTRLPYGVPASLFRWMADTFSSPQSEAQVTRAITDYRGSGFSLLSELTGEDEDVALAMWAIALFTSDTWFTGGWGAFRSWDFQSIFNALPATARLAPYEYPGFGGIDRSVSVRAGSTAYFLIRTGSRNQASIGAQGLPDHMRAWIIRLR